MLIILCMIFARSAAMAFNRYIDRDIDQKNNRTSKVREIPNGTIKPKSALIFVIINSIFFVLTCYYINTICLLLSPVALLIILGYSYTKRFTALCHLILGIGLSLAPLGAYLAVTGEFSLTPILFSIAVLFGLVDLTSYTLCKIKILIKIKIFSQYLSSLVRKNHYSFL